MWLSAMNIRDFAQDKHRSVDDTPAGGGAGMVMRADVAAAAIDQRRGASRCPADLSLAARRSAHAGARPPSRSRRGRHAFCGRFEGLDQRVIEARPLEEISIGDYVLSGGEIAPWR